MLKCCKRPDTNDLRGQPDKHIFGNSIQNLHKNNKNSATAQLFENKPEAIVCSMP